MVAKKEPERVSVSLRLPDDLARRLDAYSDGIAEHIPISRNSLIVGIVSKFLDCNIPPSELFDFKPNTKRKTKKS